MKTKKKDLMEIEIDDNGKGMEDSFLKQVLDPFKTTRTTRRVGLGLPIFSMTAKQCGGDLKITSQLNKGTNIKVHMQHSHWDRPPLGNIKNTLISIIVGNPDLELLYEHKVDDKEFVLDTKEIKSALGEELPINDLKVLNWLKEYIEEGLSELYNPE